MRSPATAIAWELVRRHRWGFGALALYLLLLATTDLLIVVSDRAVVDASEDLVGIAPMFAAKVVVPVSYFTYYFLAVFSYGFAGDLTARQSMYPPRMFALPVTTNTLVLWPMVCGAATVAVLWMAATVLAAWPSGLNAPLVWPALFMMVSLAWTQALMWLPYGLQGMRLLMTVLLLATIDAAAFTALDRRVSQAVMIAALAPQLPVAFVVARFAVARARRGDVPDWRDAFGRLARFLGGRRRGRAGFTSAARAQAWYEWRLHGWSLPGWVAILLPFELVFLFVAGRDIPSLVAYTVVGVLLTPPLVAAFAAPGVRTSGPHPGGAGTMSPFLATRPLTSAELTAAKLRMAARSTLVAWLIVAVLLPVALVLSDAWPVVAARARRTAEVFGTPRAVVAGCLGVLGPVVWTWKQLVQTLYVGLSGREWITRASMTLTLIALIFVEPVAAWIHGSDAVQTALWNAIPWVLTVLVAAKVSAAAWIAWRLESAGVIGGRSLVAGAAGWAACVLSLHALFVWLTWGPLIQVYLLALIAILAIPLVRVSAAPLALAWNRHR